MATASTSDGNDADIYFYFFFKLNSCTWKSFDSTKINLNYRKI